MNKWETPKVDPEVKNEKEIAEEMENDRKRYGVSILRLTSPEQPWKETKRADADFHNEFWEKFKEEIVDGLASAILKSVEQDAHSHEVLEKDNERSVELNNLVKNLAETEVKNIFSDVLRLSEETGTLVDFIKGESMPLTSNHLYEDVKKDILIRERLISQGIINVLNDHHNPEFFLTKQKLQSFINNETNGLLNGDNPERLKNLPYYASLGLKGQAIAHYSKLENGSSVPALGKVLDEMTDLVLGKYDLISGEENEEFNNNNFDKWIVTRTKIQNQLDRLVGRSSYATIHRGEIDKYLTKNEEEYHLDY